ncbi:hypothetical protein BMF77_pa00048 (plasmid) [Dolichospermum sp. UHCC 0315A]|jgi:hypothetical protein|nr:hypothetical protein BMF77_04966 [Dolichospermum sp. UHCC 0315A]QEI44389.1 hypothetical protein BMF77_pa00048 [Dolichospermum sp. UHCC 0315A]
MEDVNFCFLVMSALADNNYIIYDCYLYFHANMIEYIKFVYTFIVFTQK